MNLPILCEEVFDEHSHPSEEEIKQYAVNIGIDPVSEPHLLQIAKDGLMHPLPSEWKPCYDSSSKRWYYYNTTSGASQWEHPLDQVYRHMVKRGRSEGYSSAAEDDSKATLREELRSFEEVSDITSSKADELPKNMTDKKTPSPGPLLLRRKQLQMDPLSRSLTPSGKKSVDGPMVVHPIKESLSRSLSNQLVDQFKEVQPLRRARTLDPISGSSHHDDALPIKGILRESSFIGNPSRSISRLEPLRGEISSNLDYEDEKKRSVRFADFEKKALDIQFKISDSDSTSEELGGGDLISPEDSPEEVTGVQLEERKQKLLELSGSNYSRGRSASLDQGSSGSESVSNVPKIQDEALKAKQTFHVPVPLFPRTDSTDQDTEKDSENVVTVIKKVTEAYVAEKDSPGVNDITDSINLSDKGSKDSMANQCLMARSQSDSGMLITATSDDLSIEDMEEVAKHKAAKKLALLEDKLTKEIHERINQLKKEKDDEFKSMIEKLKVEEQENRKHLQDNMDKRLEDIKIKLEEEFLEKENSLRAKKIDSINELEKKLDSEREELIPSLIQKHDSVIKDLRLKQEKELVNRQEAFNAETKKKLEELRTHAEDEIKSIKNEHEALVATLKDEHEKELSDIKSKFENEIKCLNEKHRLDKLHLQEEHQKELNELIAQKGIELKRVETEWDDKITAATLQHEANVESIISDHERTVSGLRHQYFKEEEDLKKQYTEKMEAWNQRIRKVTDKEYVDITQINRDFEKVRCEKRLLEDKYRSLKDKYMQLKNDVKMAVERKLQSKAKKKHDETANMGMKESHKLNQDVRNKPKSENNNPDIVTEESHSEEASRTGYGVLLHKLERATRMFPREVPDNDMSSDEQHTSVSSAHENLDCSRLRPKFRSGASKSGRFKSDERDGHFLDDIKSQLHDLEAIEERIPADTQGETYLRYPFNSPGISSSAEVDFYRHRVIVEQEAVKAARECLLQQKKELEAKQNSLRVCSNTNTLQQLQQQERDLTEMEVSLHRTRALLGEKMIRLRLLGQTLDRIVKDNSLTPFVEQQRETPGDYLAVPSPLYSYDMMKNVEIINSEIRDIWSHLSHQPSVSETAYKGSEGARRLRIGGGPSPDKIKGLATSPKPDIEAKLSGLKQWLEKPKPPSSSWTQMTL